MIILQISTGSLGLHVPVAVAKFSDLVRLLLLLSVGSRVSSLRENLRNHAFCDATKLQNAQLPIVRNQTEKIVFSRIGGIASVRATIRPLLRGFVAVFRLKCIDLRGHPKSSQMSYFSILELRGGSRGPN